MKNKHYLLKGMTKRGGARDNHITCMIHRKQNQTKIKSKYINDQN
jgi:hypothetical protein